MMRHLLLTLLVLPLSLLPALSAGEEGPASFPTPAPTPGTSAWEGHAATLLFEDGSHLSGLFLGFTDEGDIRWRTRDDETPYHVSTERLRQLRFRSQTPHFAKEPFRLYLRDGSMLPGQIKRIDGQTVTYLTPFADEVRLPRTSIVHFGQAGAIGVEALDLDGWYVHGNKGGVRLNNNQLYLHGGSSAILTYNLPEQWERFDLHLAMNGGLAQSFALDIGSLVLRVSREEIALFTPRVTSQATDATEAGTAPAPAASVSSPALATPTAALHLQCTREGEVQLSLNGSRVLSWQPKETAAFLPARRLTLGSDGNRQTIQITQLQMNVLQGHGGTQYTDSVMLEGGTQMRGKLETLTTDTGTLTTEFGRLVFSTDALNFLRLGRASATPQQDGLFLRAEPHLRMHLQSARMQKGALIAQSGALGTIRLPLSHITSLDWTHAKPAAENHD